MPDQSPGRPDRYVDSAALGTIHAFCDAIMMPTLLSPRTCIYQSLNILRQIGIMCPYLKFCEVISGFLRLLLTPSVTSQER